MARLSREDLLKKSRPERLANLEVNRNKLFVKGLDNENFQYRWVNDTDDRVAEFLDRGYELVDKTGATSDGGVEQSGSTSSKFSKGVGGGITAYLMRIPRDIYNDYQALKQEEIDELEADIKGSAEREFKGRLEMGSRRKGGPF